MLLEKKGLWLFFPFGFLQFLLLREMKYMGIEVLISIGFIGRDLRMYLTFSHESTEFKTT